MLVTKRDDPLIRPYSSNLSERWAGLDIYSFWRSSGPGGALNDPLVPSVDPMPTKKLS